MATYISGLEFTSGSSLSLYVSGVWYCSRNGPFLGGIYHLLLNQILPDEHQFSDHFSHIGYSM